MLGLRGRLEGGLTRKYNPVALLRHGSGLVVSQVVRLVAWLPGVRRGARLCGLAAMMMVSDVSSMRAVNQNACNVNSERSAWLETTAAPGFGRLGGFEAVCRRGCGVPGADLGTRKPAGRLVRAGVMGSRFGYAAASTLGAGTLTVSVLACTQRWKPGRSSPTCCSG